MTATAPQLSLAFTPDARPIPSADPRVDAAARPRHGRLCRAILERLELGPVTNAELHQLCLHPNARLLELRRWLRWLHGRPEDWQPITCAHDPATGLSVYTLAPEARKVNA